MENFLFHNCKLEPDIYCIRQSWSNYSMCIFCKNKPTRYWKWKQSIMAKRPSHSPLLKCLQCDHQHSTVPLPHVADRSGQAPAVCWFSAGWRLLRTAALLTAFLVLRWRAASFAVQVPQHIIINLTGDLLLFQHLLNGFTCCASPDRLSLFRWLLRLKRKKERKFCYYCYYIHTWYNTDIPNNFLCEFSCQLTRYSSLLDFPRDIEHNISGLWISVQALPMIYVQCIFTLSAFPQ